MKDFWNGFYKAAKKKKKASNPIEDWQEDSVKHQETIDKVKDVKSMGNAHSDPIQEGRDEPNMVFMRGYY